MAQQLLENIRDQIIFNPEKPALQTKGQVTRFGELGFRVQGILDRLSESPGGTVLITGHKQLDAVAAMLACMFAGRPFAFIDRSNPPDRAARVAAISNASLCLAAGPLCDWFDIDTVKLSDLPDRRLEAGAVADCKGSELLYIIFTSGSTGEPKGVPVSRDNFAAFNGWYSKMVAALPGQGAHVNHASLAFDMGMLDLWPVLSIGQAVIMLDHANNILPRNNMDVFVNDGLTPASWFSTPSFLQIMCTEPRFNSAHLPQLKAFFVGGEIVPRSLVRELKHRFHGPEIRHAYGPSEVTCMTHVHLLSDAEIEADGLLPLGPVLAPSDMRIVDEDGNPVADGDTGEVELLGPQVVNGYVPRSHPANRSFTDHHGVPAYRTGDLGRVDADGSLVLLGRSDRQVKWNGNRIELDEIERAADRIEGIARAACLPVKEAGKVRDIILFVQCHEIGMHTPEQVGQALLELIPDTMVPRDIRIVEDLPITSNGKVDGKALLVDA